MYAPSSRMGIDAVEVPVPADRAAPLPTLAGDDREPGDRPALALGVAVEHLDAEGLVLRERVAHRRAPRIVRVADGRLPVACVARRHVQVALRDAELVGVRVRLRGGRASAAQ